jgi:hypothetical protein
VNCTTGIDVIGGALMSDEWKDRPQSLNVMRR